MKQYKLVMLLALLTVLPAMAEAKLVEYEFDINYQTVNFSGEDVQAMSVGPWAILCALYRVVFLG